MTAGMVLSVFYGYYCPVTIVAAVFLCLIFSCFVASSPLFYSCAVIFFLVFGLSALKPWLAPEIPPQSILTQPSDTPLTIEGIISARPSVAPDGSRLTVKVERIISEKKAEIVSGFLLLYVSEGDVTLTRGDRIRFISRISTPHKSGLPGEFDYPRYLAFQGVSATARVVSQKGIVLMRAAAVESLQRTIDIKARRLGDAIRQSITDERVSSVLTALLIGDQRRIPTDLSDAYTRAGVNHILSISGFHIGIIAAFITLAIIWLLTRFEYPALNWNIRQIALLISLPAMIIYLFLTGSAPATARSVIMLTLFAAALFAERETDSINTLLFTAFFLVAINPPTLFDVSFQLSFISLWGILLFLPVIIRRTAGVKLTWLKWLIQFVAVSAAASFATLLPVLFIFKVASINGILTNFMIVPLLGYGAVLAGFVALPLILIFPYYASMLLWPAAILVDISNHLIVWCASLPVMTFHGITAWDISFFLLFMSCMTFLSRNLLLSVFGVLIPVIALALHIYTATATDGRLHITMLSVGQAESILLRFPDGSTMLVDGGGYLHDTVGHDFGQRVLAPALGALHVRRIDRVISTHDHPDHSGGLPYIIKNFAVGKFYSGVTVSEEVNRELNRLQIPRNMLAAGDIIKMPGSVVITLLSPSRSGYSQAVGDESSVNEQSLVFRLTYGEFSMIFSADAGFEAEKRMIAEHSELKSTILKIGHHGSRFSTSEDFLDRVQPKLTLISVGAGNRFGLPSARTVELLRKKRIAIYRTDIDGTIELVTDGVKWSVSTPYKPE